ncbi:MAG: SAF domain-containing protein [Nocardioides sp.]
MPDDRDPAWGSPWRPPTRRARWGRRVVTARRAVLRRRRLLAALLSAVAVLAALRSVSPAPEPMVPVLVAARDLPSGTLVRPGDLVETAYPPATAPDGLAGDVVGRTLAAPVRRGEPITDVRLVGPALTEGYDDLVAVPVRLPDAGSVALLTVGDRIDLVATDPSAGGARVIALAAPVLALPAPTDAGDNGGLPGRLVVVGASPTAAGAIAGAAVRDFLSFTFSR